MLHVGASTIAQNVGGTTIAQNVGASTFAFANIRAIPPGKMSFGFHLPRKFLFHVKRIWFETFVSFE